MADPFLHQIDVSDAHEELFIKITGALNNYDLTDAANALLNALATVFAQLGGTLEECNQMVDVAAPTIKENIRDNWDRVCETKRLDKTVGNA